jgi:hypothetical protein
MCTKIGCNANTPFKTNCQREKKDLLCPTLLLLLLLLLLLSRAFDQLVVEKAPR